MSDREAVRHLRRLTAAARVFVRCAEKEPPPVPRGPDTRSRAKKLKDLDFCLVMSTDGHLDELRKSVV